MSLFILWPTNQPWHASSVIHSPPSRNCSLKYTSALAASANNKAETIWNNVIICIFVNVRNEPARSFSPSRALLRSVYPWLREKRVAAQMSAAHWSTADALDQSQETTKRLARLWPGYCIRLLRCSQTCRYCTQWPAVASHDSAELTQDQFPGQQWREGRLKHGALPVDFDMVNHQRQ